MNIRIVVAAHKPYAMPKDALYLPLQVGAEGKADLGWQRDDTGEQISGKNTSFCELTGHYWLWRNTHFDACGLCHYRRLPAGRRFGSRSFRLLKEAQAERMLAQRAVWVPRKRHYWIETTYSQYIHAHHKQDLEVTRGILMDHYPPHYCSAFDTVMQRRSGHRFNMFLMRREEFEKYSTWLFDVLFRLEAQLDITGYTPSDRRVFGYVGERLMDVWLEAENIPYGEFGVINLESQHWIRKIAAFLRRKIHGEK